MQQIHEFLFHGTKFLASTPDRNQLGLGVGARYYWDAAQRFWETSTSPF